MSDLIDLFRDIYGLPHLEVDQCPVCGSPNSLVRFANESMRIGRILVRNLSGERCTQCSEGEFFDTPSAARYAAAGDRHVFNERRREKRNHLAIQSRWDKRKLCRAINTATAAPSLLRKI